jgi:AraC-like DNA-binding protein
MTADDRKAPLGDSDPDAGSTILGAIVAGHIEAARAYGLPADDLARKAGIAAADLRDPDARVPLDRWTSLWEAIDAEPAATEFGFWLGGAVTMQSLGVIGFAMQHAPTVRDAFACLDRFRKVINDVISPIISEEGDRVVFHRTEPPRIARLVTLAAATPVGTLTLVRELTGTDDASIAATEAAFQHPPPRNAAEYQRRLGCPVHFNAPEVRLVLPRRLFDLPLRRPDPGLFVYLGRHAQALEAKLTDRSTVAARVRQQLLERIRDGEPEQNTLARHLGLGERTLQRRLRDEGTTFAALVDDVRLQLARMYLQDPALAIFEIAFLLGYSEPSAFQRAFRRWTGTSPGEHRRQADPVVKDPRGAG